MTARDDPPAEARGDERHRHVVLVGMMGAGKTTTGSAVARRLGWQFRDSDADLEAREGRNGAEIAAREGVDRLHELEERVLLDALGDDAPAVITAAGSVVESERCRAAIRQRAMVVWLDAPVDELLPRMATSDHRRPLERTSAQQLLTRRHDWFTELADLHLDARAPTQELIARVLAALSEGDRAAGS